MIDLEINWDDYFEGTDLKTLQINMLEFASPILKNHYNEAYVFSSNIWIKNNLKLVKKL